MSFNTPWLGAAVTRRLAVVPARGGSKRIPHKNIRDFCGRPMISYVLDVARSSGLFETIHVSTENAEVANVVENLGFKIDFPRPLNLADDDTPLMPVLRYVTDAFGKRGLSFDEVWLVLPCAPLIEAGDLAGAARLYTEQCGQLAVISVTAYPVPIDWAYSRDAGGRLQPVQPGKFRVRSQDLERRYYDSGAFYGFPARRVLESTGAGDDTGFVGYELPRHKAIDIDTEEDWRFAEILYMGMNRHRPV